MHSDVTVIIPTFNRLSFLREALDSVWKQTQAPRQIIVVDGGSDDGSWEWLQDQGERLCAIRQSRQGPAVARNRGLELASSRWIAFLDSDDYWLPEKLALQVEFLSSHPQYLFCQSEEIWLREGRRIWPLKKHAKPSGWVFSDCLELCRISPSSVMFQRDFLQSLGGFDPNFPVCEDYELWLRASLRSPFQTLLEPLVVKRGGHADQLSRAYWGMDRFRVLALEKILLDPLLSLEQSRAVQQALLRKLQILSKGFAKRYLNESNPYAARIFKLQREFMAEILDSKQTTRGALS